MLAFPLISMPSIPDSAIMPCMRFMRNEISPRNSSDMKGCFSNAMTSMV